MVIGNMTIKGVNNEINRLENQLDCYLKQKELLFETTQPKAADITKELVDGGKRINKLDEYLISSEEQELDTIINNIQTHIFNLTNFLEKELKRLELYDEFEQLVIYNKEVKNISWNDIAKLCHYSKRQCQRIYRKYKNKRDI